MQLRDRTFQGVFSSLFVYNILFEDEEVDERYFDVREDSTIFEIPGAGCRVAGHLAKNPRRIDAVDINRHHLALTALKVSASQREASYGAFYDLFGRGWNPEPRRMVERLSATLPRWMQRYWADRHDRFERSMHRRGLTARVLGGLRMLAGVDETWIRRRIPETVEERHRAVDDTFAPLFAKPHVKALLRSPINLLALGINYAQCDRMLTTERTDIVGYVLMHLKRVAATDLERNWFAWWAIAGQYNHEVPEAVPPFLRREHHARARQSDTMVSYHDRNVFDVLDAAGPRTWSHYALCDAVDWMPPDLQRRLFDTILRTSRDGGVLLYRSVETEGAISRLGLTKHFPVMEAETRQATRDDRTRQYRSVNFHRIVH